MAFLVRIEDCKTQRVWWEIRETEDDVDALSESVNSNHNHDGWNYLICVVELNDEGPDWLKLGPVSPSGGDHSSE